MSPTSGNGNSSSSATTGYGSGLAVTSSNAYASVTGLPSSSFVSALQPGQNVTNDLITPGTVYGVGALSGNQTSAVGSQVYTSSATFTLSQFNNGDALLSLLGSANTYADPSSFTSIAFSIDLTDSGEQVYNKTYTFTSLAAATNFFNDDTLDLGYVSGGVLSLLVNSTLTSAGLGGFGEDFLFGVGPGTPPPPSAGAPAPLAGAGLLSFLGFGAAGAARRRLKRWIGVQ